ncbi:MAG: DUF1772 domain-containing protein [Rhizobiaceae bacterium]|nr:DUF1772 domain-containing protein [Rhizobiaceae bacterium]MCV0405693.1 DUF1772 domain-containing protein [Rhizobiaceae bacterium]
MGQAMSWAVLLAAIGSGLLGGFFFAFSNTVMAGLGRIDAPSGVAAMQAINVVVQNPLFFLAFFGVPLISAILAATALFGTAQPGALWILCGAVLIVAGMFGVTVAANVPMNEALAGMDPASPAAADYWTVYLDRWTMWNHVRTVACLAAALAFTLAYRAMP